MTQNASTKISPEVLSKIAANLFTAGSLVLFLMSLMCTVVLFVVMENSGHSKSGYLNDGFGGFIISLGIFVALSMVVFVVSSVWSLACIWYFMLEKRNIPGYVWRMIALAVLMLPVIALMTFISIVG